MSIPDTKVRCSLVIEKKDKAVLEQIAKREDRSVNYIINQAIKAYLNANNENKQK